MEQQHQTLSVSAENPQDSHKASLPSRSDAEVETSSRDPDTSKDLENTDATEDMDLDPVQQLVSRSTASGCHVGKSSAVCSHDAPDVQIRSTPDTSHAHPHPRSPTRLTIDTSSASVDMAEGTASPSARQPFSRSPPTSPKPLSPGRGGSSPKSNPPQSQSAVIGDGESGSEWGPSLTGWEKCWDNDGSAWYYVHAGKELSRWATPGDEEWMEAVDPESGHIYLEHWRTGKTKWKENAADESSEALEPLTCWEELRDPISNCHYWYSSVSRCSQWHQPAWVDYVDPHTGATYYVSADSLHSTWDRPADFVEEATEAMDTDLETDSYPGGGQLVVIQPPAPGPMLQPARPMDQFSLGMPVVVPRTRWALLNQEAARHDQGSNLSPKRRAPPAGNGNRHTVETSASKRPKKPPNAHTLTQPHLSSTWGGGLPAPPGGRSLTPPIFGRPASPYALYISPASSENCSLLGDDPQDHADRMDEAIDDQTAWVDRTATSGAATG